MNRVRRMLRLMLAAMTGLMALAPGTAVFADEPQRAVWPFEFTYTYADQCAFPVVFHVQGDIPVTMFTDRDGSVVRIMYGGVARPTFTNTQNGNTLEAIWVAPTVEAYPDNSGTYTMAAQGHMTVIAQGGGVVLSTTGRVAIKYTPGQEPEVIFEAGHAGPGWTMPWEDISALCPYLQ